MDDHDNGGRRYCFDLHIDAGSEREYEQALDDVADQMRARLFRAVQLDATRKIFINPGNGGP